MEDDPRTQAAWRKGHLEELWAEERAAQRPDWTKPQFKEASIPPSIKPARIGHTATILRSRRPSHSA
jgi:hypothetical protein